MDQTYGYQDSFLHFPLNFIRPTYGGTQKHQANQTGRLGLASRSESCLLALLF